MKNIADTYNSPLLKLVSEAHLVHLNHHSAEEIQVCHLISVKTGGCTEDCKYCSQSIHNPTGLKAFVMDFEEVMERAREAKEMSASRVCLGCAWRSPPKGRIFDHLVDVVRRIRTELDIEVCCTLGMLTKDQAQQLKEAGLYAYNHNLDTSRRFYPEIITTRTYDERLETLDLVEKAGLSVCCGGILGLGENEEDRIALIEELARLSPDSVPVNLLYPVKGTPLEIAPPISFWELLRFIATTRIAVPKAIIRVTAGRDRLSVQDHALCFLAGANSLFIGEKHLTVANHTPDWDGEMFEVLGLKKMEAHASLDSPL
ncbi:MAG: Biotin synthase [Chlamydiae bacterium]|nr:Biotin synthase [Chlamydiota bacterium]